MIRSVKQTLKINPTVGRIFKQTGAGRIVRLAPVFGLECGLVYG